MGACCSSAAGPAQRLEPSAVRRAGPDLAAQFSRYVNEANLPRQQDGRAPTPFMSPATVVASQLNALQRNDYPERDAGALVAYAFTQPHSCETLAPGEVRRRGTGGTPTELALPGMLRLHLKQRARAARSWHATEEWLTAQRFIDMLHLPPYGILLQCDSWKVGRTGLPGEPAARNAPPGSFSVRAAHE